LSAIPLNEDKSFPEVYFARLPEIDLRTCVEIHERKTAFPHDGETDKELDEILVQQHSSDFKGDVGLRPFWRLIVTESPKELTIFTATWIWHHALADGTSALLFHEAFLAGLDAFGPNSDQEPIVKSPTTALLPPLEELHPMPISWPFFIRTILGSLFPSLFAARPAQLWTGNPVPDSATPIPPPRFQTLVLSAATTKRLAQASRREKASVTATLQCLLAASLFANLPANSYSKLKIDGPITLRRTLDIEEKDMINAIGLYQYLHERPSVESTSVLQNFTWPTARAVKSIMLAEVAKAGLDNPIALLRYVFDMPSYLREKMGKQRDQTAELSSMGLWQGKRGGNWAVGRMVFSQCANLVSGAFGVNLVTGGDGCAVLNFCWVDGAVEADFMHKVVDGVREGVEELVMDEVEM
jgi:hypothetical protein